MPLGNEADNIEGKTDIRSPDAPHIDFESCARGPTTITLGYKTQYYLLVTTRPVEELVPAPTPPSGWFDECTYVTLTASPTTQKDGTVYYFNFWQVNQQFFMPGMTQIRIHMDSLKIAATWYCDRQGFVDPIGDVNYDGKVDMNDIAMIARRYGAKVGGPKYKLACDIYLDRKIDIHDLVTVARNLQK